MKAKSKTPEQAMQAVITGFIKTKQTNVSLRRAEDRHRKAQQSIKVAVTNYNSEIAQQIITALKSKGLGLCEQRFMSNKFHIVKEDELMGIVRTGTRTTGDHYYEHDEHYVETYLKCKECRSQMNLRTGYDSLIELDVRGYWQKKLLGEFRTLYSITSIENILEWAANNGIVWLPITHQYSQDDHYRLGETVLSYEPFNHWRGW